MPSSRSAEIAKGVEVEVAPKEERDPVYWTDDRPVFEMSVSVGQEANDMISSSSSVRFSIWIDDSISINKVQKFGPIKKGGSERLEVECEPLTYEGHAVCGVSAKTSISGGDDEGDKITSNRPEKHKPVHSFSVWDKSHYESTVRRPKHLQYAIIFTSFVLIVVSVLEAASII